MKPGLKLLIVGATLATIFIHASLAVAGGHLRRGAPDRGIAILSPLECPDPCDSLVGGRYRCVPYYPGYAPNRRCPMVYGTTPNYGYDGAGAFGNSPALYGRSDYGELSGASRDEEALLHLGGLGPSSKVGYPSRNASGDMIDRMQGNR